MEMFGPIRDPGARVPKRRYRRRLAKAAAWVAAIPALCALVVLGGAAPLYMLLPERAPTPAAPTVSVADAGTAAGLRDAPVGTQAPADVAPPIAQAPAADGPSDAEMVDDAPPVDEQPSNPEPKAEIAVVPTPRPVIAAAAPVAADKPVADAADRARPEPAQTAALQPRKQDAGDRRSGERLVTIRPTPVRSAPGGPEIGVLGRGAGVVIDRCDDWCEVSGQGMQGWVHPSFLARAGGRPATRPRNVDQRPPVQDDDRWAEDDGRWDEGRAPRRRDGRSDAPDRYVAGDRWREDRGPVEYYGYE